MILNRLKSILNFFTKIKFDNGINYYVINNLRKKLEERYKIEKDEETKKEIEQLEKVIEIICTDG